MTNSVRQACDKAHSAVGHSVAWGRHNGATWTTATHLGYICATPRLRRSTPPQAQRPFRIRADGPFLYPRLVNRRIAAPSPRCSGPSPAGTSPPCARRPTQKGQKCTPRKAPQARKPGPNGLYACGHQKGRRGTSTPGIAAETPTPPDRGRGCCSCSPHHGGLWCWAVCGKTWSREESGRECNATPGKFRGRGGSPARGWGGQPARIGSAPAMMPIRIPARTMSPCPL